MAAEQVKKARGSRNVELAHGLMKYSRSKMYHRRGLWAIKAKHGGVYPRHDPKPKTEGSSVERASKFYPADDSKKPIPKKRKITPCKLRASITPGTILIILSGRFKGKRVVFLKQLPSGLLLITGPFKWNGVPLRRVNQAYVIATSTKVAVTGADVEKFDDRYFMKKAEKRKKKTEEQFFGGDADEMKKEQSSIPPERKEDQKSVDAPLMKTAELEPHLKQYLSARFTLTGGLKPHELVF